VSSSLTVCQHIIGYSLLRAYQSAHSGCCFFAPCTNILTYLLIHKGRLHTGGELSQMQIKADKGSSAV